MRPISAKLESLFIPGISGLAAAVTLSYALFATRLDAEAEPADSVVTPERAAQNFASAYRSRDFTAAAKLATGELRRSLELRVRSERLRDARESIEPTARFFVIDESFVLAKNKLRFAGVLAEEDTPDAKGWPASISVIRDGDRYLAETLYWPKGPPPDDR